jgi:hypothetical protein
VPAARLEATLKRSCHRRRDLRRRKKVFQSRGGSDADGWGVVFCLEARAAAAAASRSWSVVAGRAVEEERVRMREGVVGVRVGWMGREMDKGAGDGVVLMVE